MKRHLKNDERRTYAMCDDKTCEACYFQGMCEENDEAYNCNYFTPIDGESIDTFIEEQREAFQKDWNKYLEEFYN